MADELNPAPANLHYIQTNSIFEQSIYSKSLPQTYLGRVTFIDSFLDPKQLPQIRTKKRFTF